jgi:hypothetical protein
VHTKHQPPTLAWRFRARAPAHTHWGPGQHLHSAPRGAQDVPSRTIVRKAVPWAELARGALRPGAAGAHKARGVVPRPHREGYRGPRGTVHAVVAAGSRGRGGDTAVAPRITSRAVRHGALSGATLEGACGAPKPGAVDAVVPAGHTRVRCVARKWGAERNCACTQKRHVPAKGAGGREGGLNRAHHALTQQGSPAAGP